MNNQETVSSNTPEEKSPWFLGIFYFNPKDKRIFPPKRIAWLGWTINFGNIYSILAFGALIAAIVGINMLLKH